jgi:carboxymethylenebutenolidase
MNEHIKGLADQFGRMGYRAYAIDLYDGQRATKTSEARALMGEAMADPDGLLDRMEIVLKAMRDDNPEARRATIGWCFGGGWSLQAAINSPELVDAAVVYYGQLETDPAALAPIDAPVLGVFASRDGWITPALVEEFEAAMKQAGKEVEIAMYEADHAFANPSGDRFQLEDARDAWGKTIDFLNKHLAADSGDAAGE